MQHQVHFDRSAVGAAPVAREPLPSREISRIRRPTSALAFVCFALALIAPDCIAASDALEPILDGEKAGILNRIRVELADYEASIDSIEVKWTRSHLGTLPPGFMPFARFEWARSGRRQLQSMEGLTQLEGPPQLRGWQSFDGEHGYALNYHRSDASKLNNVRILDAEPEGFVGIDVPRLLGWSITAFNQPLAQLLAKHGARLIGKRRIRGEPCYEIEIGPLPSSPMPRLIVVWIDPQRSWLPRRIEVRPQTASADSESGVKNTSAEPGIWRCDVTAFQEVNDPLHNRTISFPKIAEMDMIVPTVITIDEPQINPSIPASRFVPEIPAGAEIEEHYGTTRYQRTVTGGEAGSAEHERLLDEDRGAVGIKSATPPLGPSPTSIDARPKRTSWLSTIFLSTAVVAFLGALGFVMVRRRRFDS